MVDFFQHKNEIDEEQYSAGTSPLEEFFVNIEAFALIGIFLFPLLIWGVQGATWFVTGEWSSLTLATTHNAITGGTLPNITTEFLGFNQIIDWGLHEATLVMWAAIASGLIALLADVLRRLVAPKR